jgi:hypothetical protein
MQHDPRCYRRTAAGDGMTSAPVDSEGRVAEIAARLPMEQHSGKGAREPEGYREAVRAFVETAAPGALERGRCAGDPRRWCDHLRPCSRCEVPE